MQAVPHAIEARAFRQTLDVWEDGVQSIHAEASRRKVHRHHTNRSADFHRYATRLTSEQRLSFAPIRQELRRGAERVHLGS